MGKELKSSGVMQYKPTEKLLNEIRKRELALIAHELRNIFFGDSADKQSIHHKYNRQKLCAKSRGLPFTLSICEWWDIWESSGKWESRGIHDKSMYVMARFGDVGGYTKGNVYITTCSQNSKDLHINLKSQGITLYKPRNMANVKGYTYIPRCKLYKAAFGSEYLGYFKTEVEARAAYLSYREEYYRSVLGNNYG